MELLLLEKICAKNCGGHWGGEADEAEAEETMHASTASRRRQAAMGARDK